MNTEGSMTMSRYIDYDAIDYRNDKMHDKSSDFIDGVIYMAQRIEEAPSIDIVRCGECIHNGSYDTDCPFGWRDGEWNMPRPCDYCSYGEREES